MRLVTATDYLVMKQKQNPRGCAVGINVNEADVLLAMFMLQLTTGTSPWPDGTLFTFWSRDLQVMGKLSASLEALGFKCGAIESEPDFDSQYFKLSVYEPT